MHSDLYRTGRCSHTDSSMNVCFSILGRIIRVTDSVIEYRRWIKERFPVSSPEANGLTLDSSGSSEADGEAEAEAEVGSLGEGDAEIETTPESSATGSDSLRCCSSSEVGAPRSTLPFAAPSFSRGTLSGGSAISSISSTRKHFSYALNFEGCLFCFLCSTFRS